MQTITFPGKEAQACRVEVGIAYRQGDAGRRADIVLIHNRRVGHQTSLLVSDQARDIVLNKILANDLQGVSFRSSSICGTTCAKATRTAWSLSGRARSQGGCGASSGLEKPSTRCGSGTSRVAVRDSIPRLTSAGS